MSRSTKRYRLAVSASFSVLIAAACITGRALDLIHKTGAMTLPLPAYSPDLNPIEKMWSKIKAYLLKAKTRSKDALDNAIAEALKHITPKDALGWFNSCGYTAGQS